MGKKTMMRKDAPWFPKCQTETDNAVVYVIGEDDDACGVFKLGCTKKLKTRISQHKRRLGGELHILFWAEFPTDVAKAVENHARQTLNSRLGLTGRDEWFCATPYEIVGTILSSVRSLGFQPICTAGFPGSVEYEDTRTEIEEILSEPVYDRGFNGALPREQWAPQSRAVGRC